MNMGRQTEIKFFNIRFLILLGTLMKSKHTQMSNLRQASPPPNAPPEMIPEDLFSIVNPAHSTPPPKGGAAKEEMERFTIPTTTLRRFVRTTPMRISFEESCDYLAHYCLKAYNTGKLCGRTLYYTYHTFKNYCLLDYVNCMERYEVWQVVHMGECFNITELTEYLLYPYDDDFFLDHYYVMEDH